MNDFAELAFMETPLIDAAGFMELILRFVLNMVVVVAIIRFFYYPKSRRRDYFFTFTLISISIFLMIFLLGTWIVCYLRHNSLPDRVDACA